MTTPTPMYRAAVGGATQPARHADDPDEGVLTHEEHIRQRFRPARTRVVLDETIGLPVVERGLYQ